MSSLLEQTRDILDMIQQGLFVEGMEKYYADDAINEEPTGVKIEGKDAIIAHEKNVLEQVSTFHGVNVIALGVGKDDGQGNGVTFAEYSIAVDMKDGSKFNPQQVQVTRWENGKAKHIRFYYNPQF